MTADASAVDSDRADKPAWVLLAAIGCGVFGSALLFSTGIGPALPAIKTDLGLSLSAQTWLVTAYTLAFGVALIAGGRMGDLIGEVRVTIIGFSIFAAGLVVAACAASGLVIIIGRGIQGAGTGLCAPATLSMVINASPKARRGLAVGLWGGAHALATLTGPLYTAWMMALSSWRWAFWGAVALPVLTIATTAWASTGYRSAQVQGRYDWPGLVVGGTGIALVIYVLQCPTANAATRWLLAAGVTLLGLFATLETRIAGPVVDFKLWHNRLFSVGCLVNAVVGFSYIPFLTFIGALFFIDVLGYSPAKASVVIIITTALSMLVQPAAGSYVDKVGPARPMVIALLLQSIALAWIGLVFRPETSLPTVVIPLALMGIGVGIALPACNVAAMSAVAPQRAGMAAGVLQMSFSVAASLGIAYVTSLVATKTTANTTRALGAHTDLREPAMKYAAEMQHGNLSHARDTVAVLPAESGEIIRHATTSASSAAITTAMLVLAAITLVGAICAGIVNRCRGSWRSSTLS
ncbi:MFS transporter [Mycobacterium avium]|uniref:MFS transporter n=1 Tax=Mycobacterium avium TaxID=1764 RepID=UPI000BAF9607|nr:MFS transporter [Mycobacterium avium]PBA68821.1 hypothetical protein CKJ76_26275 [Mycobacterium avium]